MNSLRFLTLLLVIRNIDCTADPHDFVIRSQYKGEKFPVKYLEPEDAVFTTEDLDTYINGIKRIVQYFAKSPNDTSGNIGMGLFLMKSVLKRIMRDHSDNLSEHIRDDIKYSINQAEYVISHYAYMHAPYGWDDIEFRLSRIYLYDESQIYSIAKYNRNKLRKWILSNGKINDFLESMDDATLPREKYVTLAESMDEYFRISDSDRCLVQLALIPEPNGMILHPCRFDDLDCHEHLHATPSVAYALSHRLLIILARRHHRRCYIHSEHVDDSIMDIMCAYMYREAVYIARRGFFARDLFLEHIALCSMLGYEEFLRRSWFQKAVSWMDDDEGCIKESHNYNINKTKYFMEDLKSDKKRMRLLRNLQRQLLEEPCQDHPTALFSIVLAHAIRYTLYKIKHQSNIK